jgi:hypothetical protein
MPRTVIIILICHRHKPTDLIKNLSLPTLITGILLFRLVHFPESFTLNGVYFEWATDSSTSASIAWALPHTCYPLWPGTNSRFRVLQAMFRSACSFIVLVFTVSLHVSAYMAIFKLFRVLYFHMLEMAAQNRQTKKKEQAYKHTRKETTKK